MIYEWQSVSESTNQPAGSWTSIVYTNPCALAINAGIILIRSIHGSGFSGFASIRYQLLFTRYERQEIRRM